MTMHITEGWIFWKHWIGPVTSGIRANVFLNRFTETRSQRSREIDGRTCKGNAKIYAFHHYFKLCQMLIFNLDFVVGKIDFIPSFA